jgi:hypothetical protein
MACADGWLDATEAVQLESARAKHGISLRRHYELLALITGNGTYGNRPGIAEYIELLEMALADGWLSWGEDQRLSEARRRFGITPTEHYSIMAEVVESKGMASAGSPKTINYAIPCQNGMVQEGDRVQTVYTREEGGDGSSYSGTVERVFSNLDVQVHYDDGDRLTVPPQGGRADVYLLLQPAAPRMDMRPAEVNEVQEVGILECKSGSYVRKGDWVRALRGGSELLDAEVVQLFSDNTCNIRFRDGVTKTFPAAMLTKADPNTGGSSFGNRVTIEDTMTPRMLKNPYAFDTASQSLVAMQHETATGTPATRRAEVWQAETDGDAAWLGGGGTGASFIGRGGEAYISQNPEHHVEKRELQLHAVCGTPFAFEGGVLRHTMEGSRTANVVLSNVSLTTGKWYYEVRIVDGVLPSRQLQRSSIGWADMHYNGSHGAMSAGDDRFSWGIDVAEGVAYHNDEGRMFGRPLRGGDVIGVAANLDQGILSYSVNGSWNAPLGVAFGGQANGNEPIAFVGGLRPVISVAPGLQVVPTFSGGFEYPPPTADYRGVTNVLTRPDASFYQRNEQYVNTGIDSGDATAATMSPGMMAANGSSLRQHSRSTDPSLSYSRAMAPEAHQALVSGASRISPRGRIVEQYRREEGTLSPTGSRFKKTHDMREVGTEIVGYNVVAAPEKTRTQLKLTANGWTRVPVANHALDRPVLVKENNGQALVWQHNYGTPELYQRYYLQDEPVRVIESDSNSRTVTVQFDTNPDYYGNKVVRKGVRWDELTRESDRRAKQQLERTIGFGQEAVHLSETGMSNTSMVMRSERPKFNPGDEREVALLQQIRGGPQMNSRTLDETYSSFRGAATGSVLLKPRYGSTVRVGDEVKVRLPVSEGGIKARRGDGSIDLTEVPTAQGVVDAVFDSKYEGDTHCDVLLYNQGGRKVTVVLADIVAQRPGRTQTQYQDAPDEDITGCGSFIFSRFTFAM